MNLGEPELLFARFQHGARTVSGTRSECELFVLDLVKVQAATHRRHSWCRYQSPVAYETDTAATLPSAA
jgi:hypothetical protein